MMVLDFLRQAQWLDAARVRAYLWILALLNVAMLIFLVASAREGVDRNGFLLGTDFISFWTSGRMLPIGASVYDVVAHTASQRSYFAIEGEYTAFLYPPLFLPFCWPLGFLPYFPALAFWLIATGGAFFVAVRAWVRRLDMHQPAFLLFAAFPPVVVTITHGQTSFLIAALIGGGALLLRDRPWLGGALIGLAAIKPQFGLLIPLVLVLTGQWRAICSAMIATVALGALATLAFGPEIWAAWLAASGGAQSAIDGAVGFDKMQSLFSGAKLLGLPTGVAVTAQVFQSLFVTGALAWVCWRRDFDLDLAALMIAGSPMVTPFVLDYDMTLLAFPLIWMAANGFRDWEKLAVAAAFAAAAFSRPLAVNLGVPIMPIVLMGFFLVLLRRIAAPESAENNKGLPQLISPPG